MHHVVKMEKTTSGRQGWGQSAPAPISASSTGCPLWLSCGWISTELIFGFTLVTHSIMNRLYIGSSVEK
jgi:hypothetical protein